MSFHDHVEDAVLVEVDGRCFVDDGPLAHPQDPVGESEHFGDLAGDEQDAYP
jgi:hypothetical protein